MTKNKKLGQLLAKEFKLVELTETVYKHGYVKNQKAIIRPQEAAMHGVVCLKKALRTTAQQKKT